jgi:hypothetical protein
MFTTGPGNSHSQSCIVRRQAAIRAFGCRHPSMRVPRWGKSSANLSPISRLCGTSRFGCVRWARKAESKVETDGQPVPNRSAARRTRVSDDRPRRIVEKATIWTRLPRSAVQFYSAMNPKSPPAPGWKWRILLNEKHGEDPLSRLATWALSPKLARSTLAVRSSRGVTDYRGGALRNMIGYAPGEEADNRDYDKDTD